MVQALRSVKVCSDSAGLAQAAAKHFVELAGGAIALRGRFSVALSGGETPRLVYSRLAGEEGLRSVWDRIHFFWGDERCVPPDHPESNFHMACETLLDHIPVPQENIHRMHGEDPPQQAASKYEQALRAFFISPDTDRSKNNFQLFDLLLLGLGEDGHTASLFPGASALQEKDHWVVGVPHRQPPLPSVDRVTLTLPAINAAAQVTFLVGGPNKTERLKLVFNDPPPGQPSLPAQLVQPASGRLLWLVDQAAAALIQV